MRANRAAGSSARHTKRNGSRPIDLRPDRCAAHSWTADLFGSLFEGAQSTRAVAVDETAARIRVTLARSYGGDGDRVQWQDRAVLVRAGDGYRLDEVEYGGDWAFQAGTGTLRNTLKARE